MNDSIQYDEEEQVRKLNELAMRIHKFLMEQDYDTETVVGALAHNINMSLVATTKDKEEHEQTAQSVLEYMLENYEDVKRQVCPPIN